MCLKMAVCLFSEKTSKRINLCLDCQHSCDLYHKMKYILNLLSCMSHPRAVCNNSVILIRKTCFLYKGKHYHKNLAALIQWLHFDSYFGIYKEHCVFYILWGEKKRVTKIDYPL